MTTPQTMLVLLLLGGGAALIALARSRRRRRVLERLFGDDGEPDRAPEAGAGGDPLERGPLAAWLFLAGFRSRDAVARFLYLAGLAFVVAVAVAWSVSRSPLVDAGVMWLSGFPGGVGEVFVPVLHLAPWTLLAIVASLPWLRVRSSRRRRVREIEAELPLTLELLATLGEAGLAFDSAVERILGSRPEPGTLDRELETYRLDLMAGVPRARALRRLALRIDIPQVTATVSALVQAEQVGSGLSAVLRRQADDLRARRRERAQQLAQSLPVKLTVPLVVCFLPGIFVGVLGPAFHQLFQMAESFLRR